MKGEAITNFRFGWQAINFALPMIWLFAVAFLAIVYRAL